MNTLLSFFRKAAPAPQARHLAIRIVAGRCAGHDVYVYETNSPASACGWSVESKGGRDCTDNILARLGMSKAEVIKDLGESLERALSGAHQSVDRITDLAGMWSSTQRA